MCVRFSSNAHKKKTSFLSQQATALASECAEYLDQSQSRVQRVQDQDQATTPVSQTNTEPLQHQNEEFEQSASSQCPSDTHTAHGSSPTTRRVPLSGNDSSILLTFQDRFLQFSPERFQEVKAQASALRGSKGMRVWNVAWLRCQEARQQLQERMQDMDEVFHHQPDSGSWCGQHYIDVVSTNIQTLPPDGQRLLVQSTPGPRHPQWEGIMSGEVELGKRKPVVGSSSTNSITADCSNITVKTEDQSDAGTSKGSKVTPQSPHR